MKIPTVAQIQAKFSGLLAEEKGCMKPAKPPARKYDRVKEMYRATLIAELAVNIVSALVFELCPLVVHVNIGLTPCPMFGIVLLLVSIREKDSLRKDYGKSCFVLQGEETAEPLYN